VLAVFGQLPGVVPFLPQNLTCHERLAAQQVTRGQAELVNDLARFLEMQRREAISECDTIRPGDLCYAHREHGSFVQKKPGNCGTFIFVDRE
jgi:hypothetical protein